MVSRKLTIWWWQAVAGVVVTEAQVEARVDLELEQVCRSPQELPTQLQ
jgi:hypothetical protein